MKSLLIAFIVGLSTFLSAAEICGTVVKVVDGDTFVLDNNGDKFRIRMANIDAPESSQKWGPKSKNALQVLINLHYVYVEFHTIDVFGRIVGTVYKKKVLGKYFDCVNKEMVKQGMAFWFEAYSKDLDYEKIQEEAKKKKIGVWAIEPIEYPWEYRTEQRKK